MRFSLWLWLFLPSVLLAQKTSSIQQKFSGNWAGTLEVNGIPLDFRFVISTKYDGFYSRLDVPAQKLRDFKMDETKVSHNEISITSELLDLVFTGKRSDSATLKGNIVQRGKTTPVVLKRTWGLWPVPKPQTPAPPFPYVNKEIQLHTAGGRVLICGTLSMPDTLKLHPAIILISGSGAQDRDGSIGNHHPFAVLADAFTKAGYAVLRCDDRGAGKTMASPTTLEQTTTESQAQDVAELYRFLKSQPGIDSNRIGLLGHSEGGVIAPMVAARFVKNVSFLILLAGPAQGGKTINSFQNELGLKTSGMPKRQRRSYMKLHNHLLDAINQSKDTAAFRPLFQSALEKWCKSEATLILKRKICHSEKGKKELFNRYAGLFIPWWKYFLAYEPAMDLKYVQCPVLALNGSKDNQVPADANLDLMKKYLKENGNKNVTIHKIDGLNHLFQTCKTCTLKEYFTLDETFSTVVIDDMVNWLNSLK